MSIENVLFDVKVVHNVFFSSFFIQHIYKFMGKLVNSQKWPETLPIIVPLNTTFIREINRRRCAKKVAKVADTYSMIRVMCSANNKQTWTMSA